MTLEEFIFVCSVCRCTTRANSRRVPLYCAECGSLLTKPSEWSQHSERPSCGPHQRSRKMKRETIESIEDYVRAKTEWARLVAERDLNDSRRKTIDYRIDEASTIAQTCNAKMQEMLAVEVKGASAGDTP